MLLELGPSLRSVGEPAAAADAFAEALRLASAAAAESLVARARIEIAWDEAAIQTRRPMASLGELVVELLPAIEAAGDDRGLMRAWQFLGITRLYDEQMDELERAARNAAAHARKAGWVPLTAMSTIVTALVHGPKPVPHAVAEATALMHEFRDTRHAWAALAGPAAVLHAMNDEEDVAAVLLAQSRDLLVQYDDRLRITTSWMPNQLSVLRLRGDTDTARTLLEEWRDALIRVGDGGYLSTALVQLADLSVDAFAVTIATAVVAALLFGLAPAYYSARRDLVEGLKGAGKAIAGGRGRLRHAIVVAEVALSLVLLLSAGLLVRSFSRLTSVELGFVPGDTLLVGVGLAPDQAANAAARYAYFQRALDRLRSVPGVEAVAATTYLPPFGGARATLELPDQSRPDQRSAIVQLCTGDCLRVQGIELIRGDGLHDLRDGEPPRLVVVNETLARESFAGEDPIGKRIRLSAAGVQSDPSRHGMFEIAGIVRDVRNDGLSARPVPHVYLPGAISARGLPSIVVRTRGDAAALVHTIRKELIAIDPQVAVPLPRVMTELLDRSLYAQPRFTLIVLGLFAATGTLLVAVGLFGVMAYTVSLQTREIALRMALGAGRTQVLRTVLGLGARLLGAGLLLGLPASLGATRLLREQLWEVPPYDPLTIRARHRADAGRCTGGVSRSRPSRVTDRTSRGAQAGVANKSEVRSQKSEGLKTCEGRQSRW